MTWDLVNVVDCMSKCRIISNQGHDLLSHVYIGFVYKTQISGERVQDHWSSGIYNSYKDNILQIEKLHILFAI